MSKSRTVITNPAASRLPSKRGSFSLTPPPPPAIYPEPKSRPGEIIENSEHVRVTGKPRTQMPKGGQY
jgi:hypothetical protein